MTEIRGFLRYGAMYYDRQTWQIESPAPWKYRRKMFPITPVELRKGMVLGEERIITARSGIFAWPDGAKANVYVVSAEGDRVKTPLVKERQDGRQYSYEVRIPGDQFAILVRQTADEQYEGPK